MNKLVVQLVTWNGEKYIPFLFESLKKQTYTDWKLCILDNASDDNTVEKIKKELENASFPYTLLEEKDNKGFAGGHNVLYKKHESEYVLFLNQDMYLEPDCLEKMVKYLENNNAVAGVSPRLMRWDFLNKQFTHDVDALGLKVFRNRRVVEQYTKQNWEEIKMNFKENTLEVFGLSGAFPMFRRSALQDIEFEDGTIFDENYHSYKEDVDVAFRLQSRGHRSVILLDAVAYHDRTGAGPKELGTRSTLKNKKDQKEWVKYHSYKNHLMNLMKNEYWQNLILDFFPIKWYELRKFFWFLFFERKPLKGLLEIWKLRGIIWKRRKAIQKNKKVSYKEMRKWWK
ncbi:MAG: glycosyltransferase family 2 protein [Candidatus Magasanikbacteria bacterium]